MLVCRRGLAHAIFAHAARFLMLAYAVLAFGALLARPVVLA